MTTPNPETHGYGTQFTVDEIGFIQLAAVKILVAVARRELDLNAVAEAELASRGLDVTGRWVGFPQAEQERQARIAGRDGDRRVLEAVLDALQEALPMATRLRRVIAKHADDAIALEAAIEQAARAVKRLRGSAADG